MDASDCEQTTSFQERLHTYQQRVVRWTEQRNSQLSFYNNLLLSLSVGFLSFAYGNGRLRGIHLSLAAIDWSLTLYIGSLTVMCGAALWGLIVGLSRLHDFRISAHINLTRRRVWKQHCKLLPENSPEEYSRFRKFGLIWDILRGKYPHFSLEECKDGSNQAEFIPKFNELRAISYNLGRITWTGVFWQTVLFAISILLYVASDLLL